MGLCKLFKEELKILTEETMSRKVYVIVTTRLILDMDEGISVGDVISDIDYEFISTMDGADIIDTEIRDWNIQDSK